MRRSILTIITAVVFFIHLSVGIEVIDQPNYVYDVGFDLDIEEPAAAVQLLGLRNDKLKGLLEFTPIRNTIGQSEYQYYSFSVNTSSGLGEYYQFLIFLTGNICEQPESIEANETSLYVYFSFNSSMFQNFELGQLGTFKNGYFQGLADVPISNSDENEDSILYIAVQAPELTNRTATWSYEIGVSQNDLVFQWDDRTWASLVDTDNDSALIVTGNLTSSNDYTSLNATESQYALFIYSYDYKDYFNTLNSSWCAVRNGPALFSTSNFQSSYTDRNGGLQQQFYVSGLNESTKYIAYLVSDFKGTSFGGAVYQPFEFETLDNSACQLIYDLDFCSRVAYSVPAVKGIDKRELKTMYDENAHTLYTNFSKALQQIACDTEQDAIFSPIKTCTDCAQLYKNWLCSVTIPRCTTRNRTGYKYRTVGESRSTFIDEDLKPEFNYYEVLPCVNVCQAIVRDCPADFGFQCPLTNDTIKQSYYWDAGEGYVSCNFVGIVESSTSFAVRSILVNWPLLVVVFTFHILQLYI